MWNAGLLWGQRNDPGRSRIPPETAWVLSVTNAIYEARHNWERKHNAPAGSVAVEGYWDMQQLCSYPFSANPANLSILSRHSALIRATNGCNSFWDKLDVWQQTQKKKNSTNKQKKLDVRQQTQKKKLRTSKKNSTWLPPFLYSAANKLDLTWLNKFLRLFLFWCK